MRAADSISPRELSGVTLLPSAGAVQSLVVVLHGYGGSGSQVLEATAALQKLLPSTAFHAPNGPEPAALAAAGLQWFGLTSVPSALAERVRLLSRSIDLSIDALLHRFKLAARRLAVVGFSQGAMLALHVGLRGRAGVAGVVSLSGVVVAAESLHAEIRARPRVLMIHGTRDPNIPLSELESSVRALVGAGVPARAVVRDHGHYLDEPSVAECAGFLAEVLDT